MNNIVICPICHAPFCQSEDGRSLFCLGEKRHCFDRSASGYVNLAGNRKSTGDSREAARARVNFLSKGYYAPVMEALRDSSPKEEPNDDGAGADTGVGSIPMPDPGMMEQLSSLVSVLRSMPEGGLFSPRPRSPEKEEQGERGSRRVPMEKRTALLYALKPYLSAERCRAIDYIVGMEKLGEWIRHLK